jgi:cytochrome c oxidase cbb3-type subunit III
MTDSKNTNETGVLKGEEALLLDHDYDGIQELDHPLPRWWLGILYSSIIFAAWYTGYYMSGRGPTPQQELAVALAKIEAMKPAASSSGGNDAAALLAATKDPAKVKHGSEVFIAKCFACHGDKGQGVVGPNLTDDYWIHGQGTIVEIAEVVTQGIADKGMPPWGPLLTPDEIRDVVAFVRTLHGTNPANPKAPQGEKQEFKE